MTSTKFAFGVDDVAEALIPILRQIDEENVVFVTGIDDDGFPKDSECFTSSDKPLSSLPVDLLFHLPQSQNLPAVVVTSRTHDESEDSIVEFTRRLIEAGDRAEVEVLDHLCVDGVGHRQMRTTTNLWAER